MNKRETFNLGAIVCLAAIGYVIFYLLVLDNDLPFSIGSVLSNTSQWGLNWRVLIVGFIPIYIAVVLLGTTLLSIYVGSTLQSLLTRFISPRLNVAKCCKKNALAHVRKNIVHFRPNNIK